MLKLNIKNFNAYTLLSILLIIAGALFYIYWGSRYGVWYDIGMYSVTVVLVLAGIVGFIISIVEKEKID